VLALQLIGGGLAEAFSMFWETLWALVLGFALSGAVQAFVSRDRMQKALGDHRPATLAKSSLFGVISSSCSYAASALAKTLFARGADFTTSMVFMIASTNLVVELGIVLWLLIGWQFALAEFVGGAIMIMLLGVILPRVVTPAMVEDARSRHARDQAIDHGEEHADSSPAGPVSRRLRSRRGWSDAAAYAISDLTMLRKELVLGFLIAGFLSALVPAVVWQSIFFTGHGFWSSFENVLIAPLIAVLSFVCSVGNVPLAAALWQGGASFGGVVAFVFADLITLPLLLIYRKYWGTRVTVRILIVFWATMSAAGLAVEYLFTLLQIPAPARRTISALGGIGWNATTWLNIAALLVFGVLYWLYRTRTVADSKYAKDPVCGMQVERAHAPAQRTHDHTVSYFCSDRCATRFDSDPARYSTNTTPAGPASESHEGAPMNQHHAAAQTAIDPICGMTVDTATAEHTASHNGQQYYFCSAGCMKAFTLNPDAFIPVESAQS
jgi:YHS domain-containing protein